MTASRHWLTSPQIIEHRTGSVYIAFALGPPAWGRRGHYEALTLNPCIRGVGVFGFQGQGWYAPGKPGGKMIEYWNWFITEFCKVEFLCYQAEPNWMGWVVIAVVALWVVMIPLGIIVMITET